MASAPVELQLDCARGAIASVVRGGGIVHRGGTHVGHVVTAANAVGEAPVGAAWVSCGERGMRSSSRAKHPEITLIVSVSRTQDSLM